MSTAERFRLGLCREQRKRRESQARQSCKGHIEYSLDSRCQVNLTTQAPTQYWRQFFAGRNIELTPRTIHISIPEAAQVIPLDSAEAELGILARQLDHVA